MLKLVIADDEGQTTVVPLLRDEITIGRKAGNTIRLTERNVSRNHARLVKRNGAYILEDLGSYNGVVLNGERVNRSAEVASGDQLAIGDYALALRAETVPAPQEMRPRSANSNPPPRLVVLTDPVAGAEFSLSKATMRIGRDERLDIWINHKSISHEHAEIQIDESVVTVFDLDSANGIRVNGIDTKRAIIQSGDLLELGEVRFRLLVPQGTRSLEEPPPETPLVRTPPNERKPLFALAVIAALVVTAAGAVLVTMQSKEPLEASPPPEIAQTSQSRTNVAVEPAPPPPPSAAAIIPEEPTRAAAEPPQEWEGLLAESQAKLARGRIEDAYRTADRLPADSVLRRSPEFGEIRYRYAQLKIESAQQWLVDGDAATAKRLARQVLGIDGITSKQRRDAKQVVAQVRKPKGRTASPEEALAEAHRCVGSGDNACVIRALEAGQAQSPAALALLIETYRAMDDMSAARRHMRAFVQRYPENPRTARYEQMLGIE